MPPNGQNLNQNCPKLKRTSASDGGDSKMSSMLPMMMMMSPQGSGSNPMLPMILGMMGKSHDMSDYYNE